MRLESKEQKLIMEYLRKISYVKKVIVANESGTLDIIGCYRGRFYSIEVKKRGETPSTLQQINMKKIREHGGIAFWTDTFDKVKDIFKNL
ncbi:MAG: VRR-NUC domain-containing protein [Candidatus Kapabacteria bacterium]|nr:VRR-NUC domain-containing protein [Ignavibacteriota bacterium]MCW5886346.1 VRR-NUC domain-containing protein [Candidatus Kapabacteria bacterium]